jgi:hypothetical protein
MTNPQEEWPQTPCPSGYIGTRPKNARDKAWRYAYEAPNDVGKVICIPCEKVISGGINRFKYHLAGIKKHDSTPCLKVTEEEKRFINALLAAAEEKKLNKERAKLAMRAAIAESEGAPFDMQEEEEALENIPGSLRGPRIRKQNVSFAGSTSSTFPTSSSPSTSGIGSYFVSRSTTGSQPSLEGTGWNKEVHEQTDIAAADFWFFNNLSMNVADSPYWLNLVNAISISGKGYKPPSRKDLSGRLVFNYLVTINNCYLTYFLFFTNTLFLLHLNFVGCLTVQLKGQE